ncbi:hypothetical protein [Microbacterium sp. GXF0217]
MTSIRHSTYLFHTFADIYDCRGTFTWADELPEGIMLGPWAVHRADQVAEWLRQYPEIEADYTPMPPASMFLRLTDTDGVTHEVPMNPIHLRHLERESENRGVSVSDVAAELAFQGGITPPLRLSTGQITAW